MPPQLLSQKVHGADRNLATARLYLQLSLSEQSTAIKGDIVKICVSERGASEFKVTI